MMRSLHTSNNGTVVVSDNGNIGQTSNSSTASTTDAWSSSLGYDINGYDDDNNCGHGSSFKEQQQQQKQKQKTDIDDVGDNGKHNNRNQHYDQFDEADFEEQEEEGSARLSSSNDDAKAAVEGGEEDINAAFAERDDDSYIEHIEPLSSPRCNHNNKDGNDDIENQNHHQPKQVIKKEDNHSTNRCSSLSKMKRQMSNSRRSLDSSSRSSIFWSSTRELAIQAYQTSKAGVQKASRKVNKMAHIAHLKLFGEQYSKKESTFVLVAGCIVSLNMGMINGTTLSGFLSGPQQTTRASVAGITTHYTASALNVADGSWEEFGNNICLALSYALGSFLAGLMCPKAQPYRIEPSYGPTIVVGGMFLLMASLLAEHPNNVPIQYVFYATCVANGIQNGVASLFSANLIRCGLTGATTDAALALGRILRGNRKYAWKSVLLVLVIIHFWLGGLLSFWLSRRFLKHTLWFNTGLFWMVGTSLIVFLMKELHISAKAALMGTWQWKHIFEQVAKSSGVDPNHVRVTQEDFLEMFDELDDDGNGFIDQNELLVGLLKNNITISSNQIKILVNTADENNDGFIDREEWAVMVRKMV